MLDRWTLSWITLGLLAITAAGPSVAALLDERVVEPLARLLVAPP